MTKKSKATIPALSDTSCSSCRFFGADEQMLSAGGTCLRYPPIPMMMPVTRMKPGSITGEMETGAAVNNVYLQVALSDWCGEHKRKEPTY